MLNTAYNSIDRLGGGQGRARIRKSRILLIAPVAEVDREELLVDESPQFRFGLGTALATRHNNRAHDFRVTIPMRCHRFTLLLPFSP